MNRFALACIVGATASLSFACSPVAVGDPCTPEAEFGQTSGAANAEDLTIDVNSAQCETRVCLSLYFKGRVTCPYGNNNASGQTVDKTGKCQQVGDRRGLYTINGQDPHTGGVLCCPVPGDVNEAPIPNPVPAQCDPKSLGGKGRGVSDSVYCSCRCDIPDPGQTPACKVDPNSKACADAKNELDKTKVQLCDCPSGFKCAPLCDQTHGNCSIVPLGKWGSYCVRDNANGAGLGSDGTDPATDAIAKCGTDLAPPP